MLTKETVKILLGEYNHNPKTEHESGQNSCLIKLIQKYFINDFVNPYDSKQSLLLYAINSVNQNPNVLNKLTDADIHQIDSYILGNSKLAAIKLIKEKMSFGLVDSKNIFEFYLNTVKPEV